MATDTTTIRVSTRTRERLNALAARRGESAGDLVAELVEAADEEAWLGEIEAGFNRLARDREALVAYRSQGAELETGFDAPIPEW